MSCITDCSLCLSEILNHEMNIFKCNHIFHEDCIKKWNGSCPNCRAVRNTKLSVSQNQFLNTYKIKYNQKIEVSTGFVNEDRIYTGTFTSFFKHGPNEFVQLTNVNLYIKKELVKKIEYFNILFNHPGSHIKSIKILE